MKRILKTAEIFGTRTAVCVNKYNACVTNTEAIESFCADSGIPFVGRILYDKNASVAINEGHSLARIACPAREGLSVVFANAMQLLGVTVP